MKAISEYELEQSAMIVVSAFIYTFHDSHFWQLKSWF